MAGYVGLLISNIIMLPTGKSGKPDAAYVTESPDLGPWPIRRIPEPGGLVATSLSGVGSEPGVGETELSVLAAVAPEGSRTAAIVERLGQSDETVRAAVVNLLRADLLQATADGVTLTPRGRQAADDLQRSLGTPTVAGDPVPALDLDEVVRLVSDRWPSGAERAAAEAAERHGLLASDDDRDAVVQQLADAFSQGRLSSADLEQRTGRALAARTYGELDDVLQGLGGLRLRAERHPVRRVVFCVVAFFSSPFVLLGALFSAFGDDPGDHVFGLVLLVLVLPGLFGLWRWAWPRR